MTTIKDRAMCKYVDSHMENHEFASGICTYLKRLKDGYYGWPQGVIFQKWEQLGEATVYDAYPFSQVYTQMGLGKIVCARVGIGQEPHSDKKVEENNKILKELFEPFTGEFWGGTQDEDGYITVSEKIEFNISNPDNGTNITAKIDGTFPLEVGYTSATKTYYSLLHECGKLARWPYGSKDIFLLANLDKCHHELGKRKR